MQSKQSNARGMTMVKAFNWTLGVAYNAQRKARFHSMGRARLQLLAKELGLPKGSFEIRSNQGGIAVSGEVTLHHEKVYVQIAQSCLGNSVGILSRKCNGRKDYTGGRNHWLPLERLDHIKGLAGYVRVVLLDSIWMETPAEYKTLIDGERY